MTSPSHSLDHAVAHSRTRSDHMQETAEDYVEAVFEIEEQSGHCRVIDLARRFGVTHVTTIKIVRRLEKEGLVVTEPYKPIKLTKQGRNLAQSCQERHRLVHQFLRSLGVSEEIAAVDTEGIEHHLSAETLKCMQAFINDN